MNMAVAEAKKSRAEDDRTHPRVGVVIVQEGGQVTTSHRGELGPGDHAEFTVLEKKLSSHFLAGATVYTTLEPCTTRNHPKLPCAFRLIERKVRRVVIGMLDPNPDICGKGLWALRDANVATDLFPHALMSQLEELNREFIRAHRPPSFRSPINLQAVPSPPEPKIPETGDPVGQSPQEQSLSDLYSAMIDFLEAGDTTHADETFAKFQQSKEADSKTLAIMAIIYHDTRYRSAREDRDRCALEALLEDAQVGDLAASRLASLCALSRDYDKAIQYYALATKKAHDPGQKTNWLIKHAETLALINRLSAAKDVVIRALREPIAQEDASRLLTCIAALSKSRGDRLSEAAFLTRAAQLKPADTHTRFNAAFALSEVGIGHLAVSHYRSILAIDTHHAATLNNLGVLYSELEMHCMASDFFSKAWEAGNSLAAANLALQYLEGGFLNDSKRVVDDARKQENIDGRIGDAITAIVTKEEADRARQKEIDSIGIREQSFLSAYVEASLRVVNFDVFCGLWHSHDGCDVLLGERNQVVGAEYGDDLDRKRIIIVPENWGGRLTLEDWQEWQKAFNKSRSGYAYVDEDGRKLHLFWMEGRSPSFVTWERLDAQTNQKLISEVTANS